MDGWIDSTKYCTCMARRTSSLEDASQWTYVGEGGEHAIFQDQSGWLLRIRKQDLVVSAGWNKSVSFLLFNNNKIEDEEEHDDASPPNYMETVIAACMIPYVDIPKVVSLEWSYLNELRQMTVAAGCIPVARRQDWNAATISSSSNGNTRRQRPMAKILYDYRSLPPNNTTTNNNNTTKLPCLSMELKPKAGYLAFSPLVHPQHRIKYCKSRFGLLQRLHQQGNIQKGWASSGSTSSCSTTTTSSSSRHQASDYDPMDLFSNNVDRMKTAVDDLFQCPQNNLKVHFDTTTLVGLGAVDPDHVEYLCQEEILPRFFGTAAVKTTTTTTTTATTTTETATSRLQAILSECLVAILQQETILQQMVTLQELDVLDADGAILVYQRLVELCNGSHQQAQSLLDNVVVSTRSWLPNEGESTTTSSRRRTFSLLEASPFSLPGDDDEDDDEDCSSTVVVVVASMCDDIATFRKLLITAAPNLPSEQQMDDFHSRVRSKVQLLTVAECRFLLWNWLLSLTMCDVSVFITLQQREPAATLDNITTTTRNFSGNTKVSTPIASNGDPGLVTHSWNEKQIPFAYSVRLIDCDGKPPSKLRSRHKKESVFETLSCSINDK
jgi:hypothetical protein